MANDTLQTTKPAATSPTTGAACASKQKIVNFGVNVNDAKGKRVAGPNGGGVIQKVEKFSSAARAGLLVGDEIVAINGQQPQGGEQVMSLLQSVGVGGTAKVNIVRAGKPMEIAVKLIEKKVLNLDLDEVDESLERKIAPAA